jgi:hypothetical protein
MSFTFDDVSFFWARANEAAYLVELTNDPDAKVDLQQVAEIYALLAQRIEKEQRAVAPPKIRLAHPPKLRLVKG